MVRFAICDNERKERKRLMEYCHRYCVARRLEFACREYGAGEELLEDEDADILLLDTRMAGMGGLRVKDILQQRRADTRILFVSSHKEDIPEAFGRQVYGFLKKPLDYLLFEKKMDAMMLDFVQQNHYIVAGALEDKRRIFVKDIWYIRAEGKYTKVFLGDMEEYVFSDKSISEWIALLDTAEFMMCHRSYCVNFSYVRRIQEDIVLVNDLHIPMSRRREKELKKEYRKYMFQKSK